MELKDLDTTERIALAALVHRMLLADGHLSSTESAMYKELVAELGEEDFAISSRRAQELAPDAASLRELLLKVKREESRNLIYGTLLEMATAETVNSGEDTVLQLVETLWNLKPEFEGMPSDDLD